MFKRQSRGFTLIELLVVISIIGILMVIVYVNFDESRKNSRDKIRQTTLADLQLAIEQYKSQTGRYPDRGCGGNTSWATTDPNVSTGLTTAVCTTAQQFISATNTAGFISSYPNPAEQIGEGFMYFVNADRTAYKLIVYNEVESLKNRFIDYTDTKKFAACPPQCASFSGANQVLCPASGPASSTYAVYSVGGECL